jgi:CRISPR/Cas system-associated endoribonuclease Cas2
MLSDKLIEEIINKCKTIVMSNNFINPAGLIIENDKTIVGTVNIEIGIDKLIPYEQIGKILRDNKEFGIMIVGEANVDSYKDHFVTREQKKKFEDELNKNNGIMTDKLMKKHKLIQQPTKRSIIIYYIRKLYDGKDKTLFYEVGKLFPFHTLIGNIIVENELYTPNSFMMFKTIKNSMLKGYLSEVDKNKATLNIPNK